MSISSAILLYIAGVVGAVPDQQAAPPTNLEMRLAEVQSHFQLGAEFFVNRTETQESIQRHFQMMREHGLTLARVFFIWDDIERTRDQWDFHLYDWVYDAAAANGIKIIATLCSEDPPGWVGATPFYHNRVDLNDPEHRKRAATYIEKVVGRYRKHPAQGYWLLMNEPSLPESFAPASMKQFGKWLEQKHGSVEQCNKLWFSPIRSFSEVSPSAISIGYWMDYAAYLDWKEYCIYNLCDKLRWIASEIRKQDSSHPTHINVAGLMANLTTSGRDFWKEAETVDFLGASIYAYWDFSDIRRDDFGFAFDCSLDILRGAGKQRPWWATEIPGGPAIYHGEFAKNPTPEEHKRWLWNIVGAGGKAAVFWSWHPRVLGREAGETGLVALDGRPSCRLAAIKTFAETLRQNPILEQAVPQTAHVAILYNRQTLVLNDLDGRASDNGKKDAMLSLWGCHRALQAAHVPVDFVDMDELCRGVASQYRVLYLPYCYAMDHQAAVAIRRYVEQGGTIWADAMIGWKDQYGRIAAKAPGELSDVFGFQLHDVKPEDQPFALSAKGDQAGERWRVRLTVQDADVLLRASDGEPIATRKNFGRGEAYYYATALSLGYFKHADPTAHRWISDAACRASAELPVQLASASDRVVLRGMTASEKRIAVLINWGEAEDVTVWFAGRFGRVIDIASHAAVRTANDGDKPTTLATVRLEKNSVAVLLAE